MGVGRKGEEEYAGIQKPKGSLAGKHPVPSFSSPVVDALSHAGFLAHYYSHPFEFRQ